MTIFAGDADLVTDLDYEQHRADVADVAAEPAWKPEGVPAADRVRGIAHLLDTSMTSAGHIARHVEGIKDAESPDSIAYNVKHCENHVAELADHLSRAISAVSLQYPEVGTELEKLHQVTHLDRTASGRCAPADYDVVMPGSRPGPEPA
jgi:hypothetical protein